MRINHFPLFLSVGYAVTRREEFRQYGWRRRRASGFHACFGSCTRQFNSPASNPPSHTLCFSHTTISILSRTSVLVQIEEIIPHHHIPLAPSFLRPSPLSTLCPHPVSSTGSHVLTPPYIPLLLPYLGVGVTRMMHYMSINLS